MPRVRSIKLKFRARYLKSSWNDRRKSQTAKFWSGQRLRILASQNRKFNTEVISNLSVTRIKHETSWKTRKNSKFLMYFDKTGTMKLLIIIWFKPKMTEIGDVVDFFH